MNVYLIESNRSAVGYNMMSEKFKIILVISFHKTLYTDVEYENLIVLFLFFKMKHFHY